MTTTHAAIARAPEPAARPQAQLATWCRRALCVCFAVSLAIVYLSTSNQGLWEDGYFVKRFAYNFWHHGAFCWNVADGPLYGMTSQTLQLVGTLVYALAPEHVVLGLKLILYASLYLTLLALGRSVLHDAATRSEVDAEAAALAPGVGWLPCAVGLSVSLIVQVVLMGLETVLGLLAVALSIVAIQRSRGTRADSIRVVLATLGVYVTRPDAILIPGVLLAGHWLLAWRESEEPARPGVPSLRMQSATLLAIGAGLALLLGVFYLYYGTPLPLPFYIKTHGLSVQSATHIQIFALEKSKNALQAAFFALPFLFIAAHARTRFVALLIASALVFCGYHYFATIETMGYLSRFYLPGLTPLFAAAGIAYRDYLVRRRWLLCAALYVAWLGAFLWLKRLDESMSIPHMLTRELDVPVLVALGLVLLTPRRLHVYATAAVGVCLLVGSALTYPIAKLALLDDESLLLAQIRPRAVFRGLEQLRRTLDPKVVFHTDMGAPGVLLPEARVVDLDGLLNEDITLRGARFEALCEADHPDAIFAPNATYPELRQEVLSSRCLRRYRAVTPMNASPLYIRNDLVDQYLANRAPDG
jgi:hypothetical protein